MKVTWREWLMVAAAAILAGLIILVGILKFDELDAGDIFQLLAALLGAIVAVVGALYVEARKKEAEAAAEAEPAIAALQQLHDALENTINEALPQKKNHEQELLTAFDLVDELRRFPPRRPDMKLLLDQVANGRVLLTGGQLQMQIVAASNQHARDDERGEPDRTLNAYKDKTAVLLRQFKGVTRN